MLKVGITGQSGFIATHLKNTLGLYGDKYALVPFQRSYFNQIDRLEQFVSSCDVIFHLAALNRHSDPDTIYDTNIDLVKKLIRAMKSTGSKPQVVFSSSVQEERPNSYGRSKFEGRKLFEEWARQNNSVFTGLIIPNVFGPFGRPYYNSVVATFCHQLTHNEEPVVEVDGSLDLIYVGELVQECIRVIEEKTSNPALYIEHTGQSRVSELLDMLNYYREKYFEKGIFPALHNQFEINLFNTFRSYIDQEKHFPVRYLKKADQRGSFSEAIRAEVPGQVSFSTTVPGITRGNHYHTRKIERFAVIRGKAEICLRRIGTAQVLKYKLSGDQPAYIDMPVWYTHNITNTGNDTLYTLFWVNEFYDPDDTDTYYEEV